MLSCRSWHPFFRTEKGAKTAQPPRCWQFIECTEVKHLGLPTSQVKSWRSLLYERRKVFKCPVAIDYHRSIRRVWRSGNEKYSLVSYLSWRPSEEVWMKMFIFCKYTMLIIHIIFKLLVHGSNIKVLQITVSWQGPDPNDFYLFALVSEHWLLLTRVIVLECNCVSRFISSQH